MDNRDISEKEILACAFRAISAVELTFKGNCFFTKLVLEQALEIIKLREALLFRPFSKE